MNSFPRGIERMVEGEFKVVGVVANGRELLVEALRLQPDVVVLDIAMPVMNGIEAIARLRESLPDVKLLFVTPQEDRHYLQAAFRTGGHGYVLKQSAAVEVREALRAILAGRFYVSPVVAKDLPPHIRAAQEPS